jgi:hypothetical protein
MTDAGYNSGAKTFYDSYKNGIIFVPIWLDRLWISVCVKQYPLFCCGSWALIKRKHWYQSFDVFTKHPSIDWIVE